MKQKFMLYSDVKNELESSNWLKNIWMNYTLVKGKYKGEYYGKFYFKWYRIWRW